MTAPRGFQAGATACGIKTADSDKLDLALVYTPHPTVAAAVFTRNQVKAAPVRVSREHMDEGEIRAVIVNSGNANACTGARGLDDAREMTNAIANLLALRPPQVFVCSTGVIGKPLPMERLRPGFDRVVASLSDDPVPASLAIMTSDTVPKRRAVRLDIGGREVRLGAMAKGAGMICPDMATMLCFVTSDVAIDKDCLEALTRRAVAHSFNRITIEGDMSTNDTVLVLTNGLAGNRVIAEGTPEAEQFHEVLLDIMLSLAKMIIRDAEKATRFIELTVKGARSEEDAHRVAKAVANSVLVKCAWNGGQPYWGRIMHAIGYAGVPIEEDRIAIDFGPLPAARGGISAGTPVAKLREVTDQPEFAITIDLQLGDAMVTVYTSDISEQFVDFNLLD